VVSGEGSGPRRAEIPPRRAEEAAASMDIVDAHTNLVYPDERLPGPSLWPTFRERLDVLREAGVTCAVACRNESVEGRSYDELLTWNRHIAEACQASGGLLVPSAIIQPALGERACELLRRCRDELGMRFVGEMFDRWLGYEWGTADYWRLLDCAAALRVVPIIHCNDAAATEVGRRCPEGRFLIAHLTRSPERRFAALAPYPNLYLLISGCEIAQAGQVRAACRSLGAQRVVFGSDLGAVDPVIAVHCVRRSGLSDSEMASVFAGSFRALWRWSEIQSAAP
jgi:predicted TIM-barrel fold metal-dependent hydrolase